MLLRSQVTPKALSSGIQNNDNNDKSPARQLRAAIIDPVAVQLFQCKIEDHLQEEDQMMDKKSSTYFDTKILKQDPITPSGGNSSPDSAKPELIRNLSGSLSDVKSSEDMSLLARPKPRKVSSQPIEKIEDEPMNTLQD
jgi:hypothetical protein